MLHKEHEDKAAGIKRDAPDADPPPGDRLFQFVDDREQMFVLAPNMGAALGKWRAHLEALCGEPVGEIWPETVTEVAGEGDVIR
jgi:hypothetical protein